jgi:hypothetical protein
MRTDFSFNGRILMTLDGIFPATVSDTIRLCVEFEEDGVWVQRFVSFVIVSKQDVVEPAANRKDFNDRKLGYCIRTVNLKRAET